MLSDAVPYRRACLRAVLLLSASLGALGPLSAATQKIVFVSDREHSAKYDLYLMDTDGSNQVKLLDLDYSIRQPRLSPDGTKIVFVNKGPESLCLVNADGTNLTTLLYSASTDYSFPQWSPDGSRIVCVGGNSDTSIYTVSATGQGLKRLTTGSYEDRSPCWSPDGSKIAFVSDRYSDAYHSYTSIYVMGADGSNLTRITPDSNAWFSYVDWSPKASRLVSTNMVGGDPCDYNQEVVALDSDGANLTYLTTDAANTTGVNRTVCQFPTWSADGNSVLYSVDRNGVSVDIYQAPATGGNGTDICSVATRNYDPDWGAAGPALSVLGSGAYTSNCVCPSSAVPGSEYTFRVRYRHTGSVAASYVRLYLYNPDGTAVEGSPLRMKAGTGTCWPDGVVYTARVALSTHGTYSYQVRASGGGTVVKWPAAGRKAGPIVDRPPTLSWTGLPGYTRDGVGPQAGTAGSTFTYRITYRDADGDACTYAGASAVKPGGGTLTASMATSGSDWVGGVTYTCQMALSDVGTYQHYFRATNAYGSRTWPTTYASGPVVAAASALRVTASARQAGATAAITVSLAAGARVSTEILSLAGRPVAALPEAGLQPGLATLVWNLRNAGGAVVPAGTYLVRLTARTSEGGCATALVPLLVER